MQGFNEIISKTVKLIERLLALIIILSVIFYALNSFTYMYSADWQTKEVFYEIIYRALLITIGLELARMLVTHNFLSILELLAFVVARKMLKPELSSIDVLLGVLSFVILLIANRFLINTSDKSKLINNKIKEDKTQSS
ncbi:hypothetical protein KBD45_07155 [Candidatus Dojkabacteria bacterium]|nr:hypothetical protein [Candidatus Dojkabacteria bacterium]